LQQRLNTVFPVSPHLCHKTNPENQKPALSVFSTHFNVAEYPGGIGWAESKYSLTKNCSS
jgi:hypothetical protein